ncbi:hypothetical protein V1477_019380 [Vespula maculifrons]|uniref:Uncharacterized protein n=1 Tax=Vespula maculifrons TaxID=7453 RepID=A0ABD2ASC5_VESMC
MQLLKVWTDKIDKKEYLNWFVSHRNYCFSNQTGSAGKIEVDALREIFKRFEFSYVENSISKIILATLNQNI